MLGIGKVVIAADYDILAVREFFMGLFKEGTAVHDRHAHIYKNDVRMKFAHGGKTVFAIDRIAWRFNAVIGETAKSGNGDLDRLFIINDQRTVHGSSFRGKCPGSDPGKREESGKYWCIYLLLY